MSLTASLRVGCVPRLHKPSVYTPARLCPIRTAAQPKEVYPGRYQPPEYQTPNSSSSCSLKVGFFHPGELGLTQPFSPCLQGPRKSASLPMRPSCMP